MPSARTPIGAATAMQTAQSALGNGTSLSTAGASRAIIEITRSAALTAGQITIERSSADGLTWSTATGVTSINNADGAADNAVIDFGEMPITLKVDDLGGLGSIRARISTAIVGGTVTVRGLAIR